MLNFMHLLLINHACWLRAYWHLHILFRREMCSNWYNNTTSCQNTMWSIIVYIHNTTSYILHPTLHCSAALRTMKCMLQSIYSHHCYAGIPYGWAWIKHSFLSSFLWRFCLFLNNQSHWYNPYHVYIHPDHNAFQSWTVTKMKSLMAWGLYLYAMLWLLLLLLTFCLLPLVATIKENLPPQRKT